MELDRLVISDALSENKERNDNTKKKQDDEILCVHCKRTIVNGIRCLGICVADSEY